MTQLGQCAIVCPVPKFVPAPDLVNSAEAADLLGRHLRTIHRMVKTGALTPVTKLPGRTGAYVFHRRDVERLAQEAAK